MCRGEAVQPLSKVGAEKSKTGTEGEVMGGCGPREAVGWCTINHDGWCGLESASFEEMDRLADRCGFIRVNNRYLLWKYGVPYKDLVCGNCEFYLAGEYGHGVCANDKPSPKGITVNGQKEYVDSKERWEGAKACGEFVKREAEATMAKAAMVNETIEDLTDGVHLNAEFAGYCSESPGCICERCLYHWSCRCPHGNCYDDLRAKEDPYDIAHPGKPPRTSWSWREDQAYWCRGGIFYQARECKQFVEYDETKHVVKECLESMIDVYQDGYIRCSLIESMGCEECMRRFNESLEEEEGEENVPKKTFWTKCGRQFEKNSMAEVTGYEIKDEVAYMGAVRPAGRIVDDQCRACPFVNKVTDGYGDKERFLRFECRAGSKPPNHKTEWVGSLDDKNTININSLDHNLLEEILQYCKDHPDLGAGYNADHLADCRRTLSISCSSNKKGIAAKKELIEKFFPEAPEQSKHEVTTTCAVCVKGTPGELGNHVRCRFNGRLMHEKHESCSEFGQTENDVAEVTYPDCQSYECPFHSFDENGCLFDGEDPEEDGYNKDVIKAVDEYGCFYAPVLVLRRALKEPEEEVLCESESPANTGSGSCASGGTEDTAVSTADSGIVTTAAGSVEGTLRPPCGKCRNFIPDEDFEHRGCCEVDGHFYTGPDDNTDPCEFFKRKPRSLVDGVCQELREDCPCFCAHNDGCAVLLMEGDILKEFMMKNLKIDCGVYQEVLEKVMDKTEDKLIDDGKTGIGLVETTSQDLNTINMEETGYKLIETESPGIEIPTFDYSTVDKETAEFLQEKARMISQMRITYMLSVAKELSEVHERLANHYKGQFGSWCESIGISRDTGENYVRAFRYVAENFGNIEDASKIQASVLFLASKPSAPQELQDGVKSGDITTHKQWKDREAQFKADLNALKKERDEEKRIKEALSKSYDREASKNSQLITESARERQARQKIEKELSAKNTELQNLRQQLDQAKRNSDPAKVKELGEKISMYQGMIKDYNRQIGALNNQLQEKDRQLKEKPIEVPAAKIVQVIPVEVKDAISRKVAGLYEGLLSLTQAEIRIFAEGVDPDYFEEIVDKLSEAIGVLNIIDTAVYEAQGAVEEATPISGGTRGQCGACQHADMDQVSEEQLDDEKTWCTLEDKVVDITHGCGRYEGP
jgi:hypothetical protein